ncbi:retinoblastoma-like protein 2 [Chaetodon trifascialis]|uniref:retinoblastoma-like protein 2 n=1 Tax=Chaetodon trifascialis TaxID=109706 RepID=UPI003995A675
MATEHQGNLGKPRFGPSDRLIAMFRACSRDPTEAIKARLRRMLHTFLQHYRDNAGSESTELAAKCCCEAEIWYYRILESHTSEERSRLGISDISGILESDVFQCCLVACCLEITVFSNPLPCDFPLLLHILKLAPYHFWKVIELVLRADVGLPRVVVTHLAQVEEKVLESLSWSSNSPLWEEIRANEGHLPTCQQVMRPAQLEDPKRADVQPDGHLPGAGLSLGAELPGSTGQRRSPSAVNRPRRSNSLHLFARKVYSLMGKRLRELCSTLHISDELRLKIWTCFEYSLVHCTDLMVERHLDQLLLCAIYIMAKITNGEIPFKHIMKCYRSQPLASRSVCKNVLISGRDTKYSLTEHNSKKHFI